MKRPVAITIIADMAVLALVVMLNPTLHPQPVHPGIPDKVVVRYSWPPAGDTAHINAQIAEIGYYLRVHNVTDEGYNLIAQYNTALQRRLALVGRTSADTGSHVVSTDTIPAAERPLTAVRLPYGYWKAGHFHRYGKLSGEAVMYDRLGRVVCALMDADTVVYATRTDSTGVYRGQMDSLLLASGQGTFDAADGSHYEGFFADDKRHGFGFESSPHHQVRIGQWKNGKFLGERLQYTAERIYGIDISRHQHEKGRKRYGISWRNLRITSLGARHDAQGRTFPVSFVYIKSTEGTTVRNRYFASDYNSARRQGIKVGAYHFFSLKSTAQAQAAYFLKNTMIREDDFPPVLDVEPTDAQISQIGGGEELLRRVRQWLQTVERKTGKRPILYINQMFINKYMQDATDIKQHYNVWIARYGEYKPDVKLVYWQLTPDGRVDGITGPVDINVFNGYQGQWNEFLRTGIHQ